MPTYAYRCSACSHEFDAFQKFSEDPLTECPNCGSAIHRVFQPVGVVFKGSGWYINDSRSKSSTTASPDSSSKSDKADSKTDKSAGQSATPAAASSATAPVAKAAAD
jgi:putative FmdB family regulatory protein